MDTERKQQLEQFIQVLGLKEFHNLLGAAGAVEAIACAMTIETGKVHPTINLVEPEDELKELGLNYVPNKAVEADVNVAISNSFGFGGHNATLLFKKYAE